MAADAAAVATDAPAPAAAVLLAAARRLHGNGDYQAAAAAAGEAILAYPLLAAARLALGKILLAQGSAGADCGLLAEARRLFAMAAALDPAAAEPRALLRLTAPAGSC